MRPMLVQTRRKLTVDEEILLQHCLLISGCCEDSAHSTAQDAIKDEVERTKSRIIMEKEKLALLKSILSKIV